MSDRWWMAAVFYPGPAYVGVLVLQQFSCDWISVLVGLLLSLGFGLATAFGLVRHPVLLWIGYSLLVAAVGVPIAYAPGSGDVWLGLSVGVLVGAPFLWLDCAWRESFSPAVRILALEAAFVSGILSIATLTTLPSTSSNSPAWQFLYSMGQVLTGQIAGVENLLTGNTPTVVPLEVAFNPLYTALGGVALVALVLSWVSPRTALGEPLPWSWFRSPRPLTPSPTGLEGLSLRPGQLAALSSRTRSSPPDSVLSPGFGAVLSAGVLVALFIGLAATVPPYALLGIVTASAVALAAVALALSRKLTAQGQLAG
jgi:hypothetical protein